MASTEIESPSPLELTLAIRAALPDGASLEAIAGLLGLSSRTLQRRLTDRGLTLSDVLARVRRDRAVELLGDRSLGITRIAHLVGFTNLSSFSRAFRIWTGLSPRAYRRLYYADAIGKAPSRQLRPARRGTTHDSGQSG